MGIAGLSIRRPILIYVFLLAMGIMGIMGYGMMGLEFYPEIDVPWVIVITVYPGASLWEVETEITERLEDQLVSVSDIKNMDSSSKENVSIIMMEFEAGAGVDTAASDVRDRIGAVEAQLPDDAEKPMVLKFDLNAMPIIDIAVSAKRPSNEIREYIDDFVRDRLAQITGVASVSVSGGREREVQIKVDRSGLERYGVSIANVVGAIQASNLNFPVGKIKKDKEEITVRIVGEVEAPAELEEIRVQTMQGMIPLKEFATVEGEGLTDVVQYSRMNGREAIVVSLAKKSGANTAAVSANVAAEMKKIEQEMPEDYEVIITRDQSEFIVDSLNATTQNLLIGALLAAIMVFLFLGNFRTTIIIALAIPISVLGTFMLMFFSGFTLNIMTLMALTISVGMMVDNSVVILENIYRHMEMGKTPVRAAIEGTQEISLAVMASALTNIIVFASFAFMGGTVGQFFKAFGLTICFVYLISLVVAFTLTPTMMAHFLKQKDLDSLKALAEAGDKRLFDKGYSVFEDVYKGVVNWALRHRAIVFGATMLVFISSIGLIAFRMIGSEFFPSPDQGWINVGVELPVSASLNQTNELMLQVEKIVTELEELDLYTVTAGGESGFFVFGEPETRFGSLQVNLAPRNERKRSTDEIIDYLRERVAELPGGATFAIDKLSMGGPPGRPIEVQISGPDFSKLEQISNQIHAIIKDVPGTSNVASSWKVGKPELEIRIRNHDAQVRGLNVAYIGMQLRAGIYGDDTAKYRDETGQEHDIRVRLPADDRMTINDIRNFPIATPMGEQVRLADVADIIPGAAPTTITRKGRQRIITIGATPSGRSMGIVVGDISRAIKDKVDSGELELPSGYRYEFAGETEEMNDMMMQMMMAVGLGIIFVFLVMAAQFNSFFHPLAIMAAIPFAFVGVFYGLFVGGQTINMMSMIGSVLLVGIVVNNAIVLVDYTNILRQRGMERMEALLTACPIRLRPVVMTALTTIIGITPAIFMSGAGNEIRRPIAVAVIGGLLASTVLTLVVVPVIYTLLDDLAIKLGVKTDVSINETIEDMECRLYGGEEIDPGLSGTDVYCADENGNGPKKPEDA